MSKLIAYKQDSDGNEQTLSVFNTDPADGTYCIPLLEESDENKQVWIRIVNIKDLFCDMVRNLPIELEDGSIFDEMSDFLNEERNKRGC